MEKTTLERSIREESQRLLLSLKEKESVEVQKQDEACAAEIESFRKKHENETDKKISLELERLENRGLLELKKANLKFIETFINHNVKEVVKGMRKDQRYQQFLLQTIRQAASSITGKVEVLLAKDDCVLEKEIKEVIKEDGANPEILINDDPTINWGGCIISDPQRGLRFNSTMERIYFRKLSLIRRYALRILKHKGFAL